MNQAAVQTETRQSLTAEAWANAALEAIAQGGLDAVAVEPLARKLKVTKGSFYWHFTNRGELIRAALALWEKSETVDILERIEPTQDPYERIVTVFKQANASYRAGRLYLAIASGEDHPVISEYVRRVSESRMNFLRDCYRDLGFSENRARHWARFAYATFMGNLQIRRDTPDAMPQGDEFNEYLRLMITTLIPREVVDDSAMRSAATRRLPAGQRVRERPKADAASTQKQQVIEVPAVSDAQRVADESESASRVVQMRRNAKP